MKNPPTLADACSAVVTDKRFNRREGYVAVFNDVVHARKFVLDKDMSAYLAELSSSFWRGGLRKRNRMLENVRQQARLPHVLTWIEIDFLNGYLPRSFALENIDTLATPGTPEPPRYGWLLRQHPKVETSFMCTEFRSTINDENKDRALVHPTSIAWSTTDDPIAWPYFGPDANREVKDTLFVNTIVGIPGYTSSQVQWTSSFEDKSLAEGLLLAMAPPSWRQTGKPLPPDDDVAWRMLYPRLLIRDVWALLATLNDLPVRVEHIEPSKGYVARGRYRKFLEHNVIHLTVPETKWRKLVLKTAALLRRRAHQVRGHWRKDWRNPLAVLCNHEFDEHMICRRCQGKKLWIAEHQRGDASLGFVIHDYQVHHQSKN